MECERYHAVVPDDFCGKNQACAGCKHCPEGKPEPARVNLTPGRQIAGNEELRRIDNLLRQLEHMQQYPKV